MFDQHRCELFKTSEASFTAGNNRGASNFFDAWITISQVHPLCKEYLISLAALNREKKRHKDTGYWWIIHPFSKLRYPFLLFVSISCLKNFKFKFQILMGNSNDHCLWNGFYNYTVNYKLHHI